MCYAADAAATSDGMSLNEDFIFGVGEVNLWDVQTGKLKLRLAGSAVVFPPPRPSPPQPPRPPTTGGVIPLFEFKITF